MGQRDFLYASSRNIKINQIKINAIEMKNDT